MGTKNPEAQDKQQTNRVEGADAKNFEEAKAKAKATVDALWENVHLTEATMAALNAFLKESDIWKIDKRRNKDWSYVEVTKNDVLNIVNKLKEPYKGDIFDFIKSNDIEWMQEYLNQKIDEWRIDKDKLAEFLKEKKIRFDGHIEVDWKFGPQTLYTMKFIIKKQKEDKNDKGDEEDKEYKEDKEDLNQDWIEKEMWDALDELRNGKNGKDWHSERNDGDNKSAIDVDKSKKIASLTTWTREVGGSTENKLPNNKCELDLTNGKYYVYCGGEKYEMPLTTQPLDLDENWYPTHTPDNVLRVRAFTRIWNLMNMLKVHYVVNWGGYSFEESEWELEYNNGTFNDTEIVSKKAFEDLNQTFHNVWIKFDKAAIRDMACLLNAMKLDAEKLTEDELNDGCTDADVAYSKQLSHKHNN